MRLLNWLVGWIVIGMIVDVTRNRLRGHHCRSKAVPGVDWRDCKKRTLVLKGIDLGGANLAASISPSLTSAKQISFWRNLEEATLSEALLEKSNAVGANFRRVEGFRARLQGIDAKGAIFVSAELQRAELAMRI